MKKCSGRARRRRLRSPRPARRSTSTAKAASMRSSACSELVELPFGVRRASPRTSAASRSPRLPRRARSARSQLAPRRLHVAAAVGRAPGPLAQPRLARAGRRRARRPARSTPAASSVAASDAARSPARASASRACALSSARRRRRAPRVRVEVVRGDHLDDLLLVRPRGRRCAAAARWRAFRSALRERLVGDPLEQVLEEAVLAALRRARVGLDGEHLLADERRRGAARARPRPRPASAATPGFVNVLPRTAASWTSARSSAVEAVEPRGDERVQRLRDVELLDRPGRAVRRRPRARAGRGRAACARSRPRRAARPRRGRGSARAARPAGPGTSPSSSSSIASSRERLERERRGVARRRPAAALGRAPAARARARRSGRRATTRAGAR